MGRNLMEQAIRMIPSLFVAMALVENANAVVLDAELHGYDLTEWERLYKSRVEATLSEAYGTPDPQFWPVLETKVCNCPVILSVRLLSPGTSMELDQRAMAAIRELPIPPLPRGIDHTVVIKVIMGQVDGIKDAVLKEKGYSGN